jgi:hypothetical protein
MHNPDVAVVAGRAGRHVAEMTILPTRQCQAS